MAVSQHFYCFIVFYLYKTATKLNFDQAISGLYSSAEIHARPGTRWVLTTVKELTEPDSEIAQLLERAIQEWPPPELNDGSCGSSAQEQ